MTATETSRRSAGQGLLGGWISRLDLALELGVTVETLRRWEAQRFGPPCVRAGRKVYYRRDGVHDWLQLQEVPTQAIDGKPCELEFNYSLGANASFTFTAHAVYLPIPRIEISGPQGVQASFDWQAAKATRRPPDRDALADRLRDGRF